jgi:hypothetical protein
VEGPSLESKMDDRAKIRKNNLDNHLRGETEKASILSSIKSTWLNN